MENRLKRQHDFDLVFNKGKRAYTSCLSMFYFKVRKGQTKLGISISKKHGNAVVRNRIKRLLRAVYIPIIPKIKESYLIVFLPRVKENNDYSFSEFSKAVEYLLKKENLIIENDEKVVSLDD